jgi:hypothetical protein
MQEIMMNKIIPISKKNSKKTTVGSISSPTYREKRWHGADESDGNCGQGSWTILSGPVGTRGG